MEIIGQIRRQALNLQLAHKDPHIIDDHPLKRLPILIKLSILNRQARR